MRHHRECPDQSCAICLPLRRRLAAAKIGVSTAGSQSAPPGQQPRRKTAKRKKDDEDDAQGGNDPLSKRKRKDGSLAPAAGQKDRGGAKKRGAGSAVAPLATAAQEAPQEAQMAGEGDFLESGFCVSVHFAAGKKSQPVEEMRGALPRTMQALQPFLHPLNLSVGLDRCNRPAAPR